MHRSQGSSWLALQLLLTSCGAALQGHHFHKHDVDYEIGPLSAAWTLQEMRGQDLLFTSPGLGSIGVHATCRDYEDVPSSVLLDHLLFGTTERTYLLEEEFTLDGRAARHARIDAELDGVPVRMELFVLVHAPCVVDLSYVSDRQARGRGDFIRFVHGFAITAVRDG